MSNHKSLIAFTLIIQSAVGGIWCIGLALLLGDTTFNYEWHTIVALLLVFAGLCCSIGHLGRPYVCFYAIRNLKHSWLSREIAASVILVVALTAMTLANLKTGTLNSWLIFAASTIGVLAIYVMAQVYRLRTVPSWNRTGTYCDFFGSALLLGGLQFFIISTVLMTVSITCCNVDGLYFSQYVGLFVGLIGLVLKVETQSANSSLKAKSKVFISFCRPVLQVFGAVLWVISIVFVENPELRWIFLLPAAFFLVIGEIIQRIHFYNSYHSVGL